MIAFGTSAANKNIGKLTGMSVEGGSSTSYTYDSVGRPATTSYTIDSNTFITEQSYDSSGRPDVTTYPDTDKYSTGFQVRRVYNSSGTLIRVESTDTTPLVFWQADPANRNARGQVALETLGNDVAVARTFNAATGWLESMDASKSSSMIYETAYTYDDLGNLLTRTYYQPNAGLVETFAYDVLNRLLSSDRSDEAAKSYVYDDLGNIVSKAGATYSYTGCGGPHALCSDGTNSYAYDANGNMTSRGGKTVTYNGFNLPYEFKEGSSVLASFAYDAERNRVLKIAGSLHVRYVGMTGTGNPLFEQEYNGSTARNIHYIYADGAQAVAQHITIGAGAETQYFHRDHLGSVEATSDDAGTPNVDYIGYDAWGSRIDSPDAENVRLGFTGHEMISEQTPDLVHMNGRVYDPAVGRFLSADPNIPDPFSSQSYNRYSYVSNNPVSYPDPTGYNEGGWEGQSDTANPVQHDVYGWVDPTTGIAYTQLGGVVFPEFQFSARGAPTRPNGPPGPDNSFTPICSSCISYQEYMYGYSSVPGYGNITREMFGAPSASSYMAYGQSSNQQKLNNNQADRTDNWFAKGDHEYSRVSGAVCSAAAAGCTQGSVVDALNTNGVHPNQSKAFVPGNPYVADVDIPGPFGKDHISTTAIYGPDGTQIGIRNVTLSDHALRQGTVDRVVINRDGNFHIHTHGTGTGYLGGPNIWLKDMVWGPVDNNVIKQFQ